MLGDGRIDLRWLCGKFNAGAKRPVRVPETQMGLIDSVQRELPRVVTTRAEPFVERLAIDSAYLALNSGTRDEIVPLCSVVRRCQGQ